MPRLDKVQQNVDAKLEEVTEKQAAQTEEIATMKVCLTELDIIW